MSSKTKIVLITIVSTTAGWVVLLFAVFFYFAKPLTTDVSFVPLADIYPDSDYVGVLTVTNQTSNAVTYKIDIIRTNDIWTAGGPVVLEAELRPGGLRQWGVRKDLALKPLVAASQAPGGSPVGATQLLVPTLTIESPPEYFFEGRRVSEGEFRSRTRQPNDGVGVTLLDTRAK